MSHMLHDSASASTSSSSSFEPDIDVQRFQPVYLRILLFVDKKTSMRLQEQLYSRHDEIIAVQSAREALDAIRFLIIERREYIDALILDQPEWALIDFCKKKLPQRRQPEIFMLADDSITRTTENNIDDTDDALDIFDQCLIHRVDHYIHKRAHLRALTRELEACHPKMLQYTIRCLRMRALSGDSGFGITGSQESVNTLTDGDECRNTVYQPPDQPPPSPPPPLHDAVEGNYGTHEFDEGVVYATKSISISHTVDFESKHGCMAGAGDDATDARIVHLSVVAANHLAHGTSGKAWPNTDDSVHPGLDDTGQEVPIGALKRGGTLPQLVLRGDDEVCYDTPETLLPDNKASPAA